MHYLLRSIGNIHHWVHELSEFNETFQNRVEGIDREMDMGGGGRGAEETELYSASSISQASASAPRP